MPLNYRKRLLQNSCLNFDSFSEKNVEGNISYLPYLLVTPMRPMLENRAV